MKICLNVVCKEEHSEPKKRMKLEDGVAPKKMRSTSVRKLIILALAPGLPENYDNVMHVMQLLHLQDVPYSVRYAADLKMINLLLGLMSYSSRHPCSFCDIPS